MALNYKKLKWFLDSPYFVMELDNWHLRDDAPEDLKKRFDAWKKERSNGRE